MKNLNTTIGQKLSPILEEIEITLLEFEANRGIKPEFTFEGFRAALKIFMAVMMDKIYELQDSEKMSNTDRLSMAQKCGEDIRKLIKTYTNLDTHTFYNLNQKL